MSKVMDLFFKIDVAMTGKADGYISKFNQKMAETAQTIQRLNQTSGNIKSYQDMQSGITQTSEKLSVARKNYQQLSQNTQASKLTGSMLLTTLTQEQARLKAIEQQSGKTSQAYKIQNQRVKELQSAYDKNQSVTSKFEHEQAKAGEAVKRLEGSLSSQQAKLQNLGSALREAGVNTHNLTRENAQLQAQMQKIQALSAKAQALRGQVNWGSFKDEVMKAGALLKTFEKPIRVNMEFEQAMANVKAVMNPTQEDFQKLYNQSIELGSKTQFTAIESANAQENLARAGFNSQQILDSMPHILAMAAADGMSIAQASEIMSKTLSQFELDSSEAKRVADVLAMTSASSNTDIAKIGEGMVQFAPQAKLLSISLEQAAAILGSIANNYKDGSEGGTAATRITQQLQNMNAIKGSGKKGDILNGLNVVIQKDGRLRNLDQIFIDLNSQMDKLGMKEKQRAQVYEELFGKKFSSAAGSFTSQVTTGKYNILENKVINERDNKAQDMAKTRNDTLQGDITSLTSAWEGFMIKVGKPLEGWSRNIVQGLTKALTGINDFITQHSTLMDIVTKLGAGYAAWKIGSSVLNFFGKALEYGRTLWELHSALKAAGGAQAVLNMAMNANPIGLIITAIAGLIALLWNWDSVTQYVSGVWRDLVDWWNNITLADIFSPLYEFAVSACERLKKPFIDIYNWICDLFASLNPFANIKPSAELANIQKSGMNGNNQSPREAAKSSWENSHKARAMGGMITRPEIALIGEAGPEAIIPLSPGKKSRGLQVLSMAADSLGVNIMPNNFQTITQSVNNSRMNTIEGATNDFINQTSNYTSENINTLSDSLERPYTHISNQGMNNYSPNMSPVINITVNANNNQELESQGTSLANNIYERVKEALSEIMNNEARLSYA